MKMRAYKKKRTGIHVLRQNMPLGKGALCHSVRETRQGENVVCLLGVLALRTVSCEKYVKIGVSLGLDLLQYCLWYWKAVRALLWLSWHDVQKRREN